MQQGRGTRDKDKGQGQWGTMMRLGVRMIVWFNDKDEDDNVDDNDDDDDKFDNNNKTITTMTQD